MAQSNQLAEYERTLKPDPKVNWLLEYPDLPGCTATGNTPEEAFHNGEIALRDYAARAKAAGFKLPEPGSARQAAGQVKVRVPRDIHRRLFNLSQIVDMSLSAVVLRLLYAGKDRLQNPSGAGEEACSPPSDLTRSQTRALADADRKFPGVWLQRLPRELHVELQWIAKEQSVSHNLLLNSLIAAELGRCEALMPSAAAATAADTLPVTPSRRRSRPKEAA